MTSQSQRFIIGGATCALGVAAATLGYLVGSRRRIKRPLRRTALLLGDSITQYGFAEKEDSLTTPTDACAVGWAALIADHYSRKVDVINRGLSGYNTRKVLAVLPRLLDERRGEPRLLLATLFLGANDSAPDDGTPLCSHVPVLEYEANLCELLRNLHARAERVLLIGPPPIDPNGSAIRGRTTEATASYATAARRAAEAVRGTLFVDTFGALTSSGDLTPLFVDGVHLSAAGNRTLANLVIAKLEEDPVLDSNNLAWDLPGWRSLDRESPELSEALVTNSYRVIRK